MREFDECTKAQKIERWTNVLRVLEGLSPHERRKHWDMGDWGTKTDCGTIACAAGHCGMDPWFRRRGFKLEFDGCFGDLNMSPYFFFGVDGSDSIFYNSVRRPVSAVIREVRAYLKELRSGG